MAKNWCKEARDALEHYPWSCGRDKQRAQDETERVSFGACVEFEDLPLNVQRWWQTNQQQWVWHGEAWHDIIARFEASILQQALDRANGKVSLAARLLKTTNRVVRYKAKQYGLLPKKELQKN